MSEAKRLKALEVETTKLKKLLAKAMLGNAMPRDIATKILKPAVEREAVVQLVEQLHGRQRQTWKVIEYYSMTVRRRCVSSDDGSLRDCIAD